MTHFLKIFSFLIFALVFSILGSIVLDKAKAWVEAPAAPPGYGAADPNDFKPVSKGGTDEYKTGRLGVKTDGFDPTFGLTVGKSGQSDDGIKVSGTSYLEDGDLVIEAGRSLCFQTGADCQSSWAGSSYWVKTGNNIYYNTGNVGIGTATFVSRLQVEVPDGWNTSYPVAQIINNDTTDAEGMGLLIQSGDASTDYILKLKNRLGAEVMHVTGNGNVGIGTPAPDAKLQVSGGSSASYRPLKLISSSQYEVGEFIGPAYPSLLLTYNGGGTSYISNYNNLGLAFGADSPTWATADMVILNSGNVGIGTTAPTAPLHSKLLDQGVPTTADIISKASLRLSGGTDLHSSQLLFGSAGGANNTYWIQAGKNAAAGDTPELLSGYSLLLQPLGGDVGIGTTAPGAKLHIQGALSGLLFDGSTSVPEIKSAGSNVDLRLSAVGTGGWVALRTNGTDRLIADASGTVTVGGTLNAGTLQQGGTAVCLSTGTNCPSSTTPTLQAVTNQGSTTSNTITADGFIDWDNTSYKIDPDYISTVNQINFTTSGNEAIYSDGSYLYLRSNSTAGGIRLINRSGASMGYLYGDGSSFGLLTTGGNWAVYMDQSSNWYASSMYDKDNTGYYVNPASGSNMNTVTAATFAGSSRFSITPGSKTYGSLRVDGSGNGYSGIYFADDDRTFMVDSQYQGIYQEGVGWQWYWNNGTLEQGTVPWARLSGVPSITTPNLQAVTDQGKVTTQDITAAAFYVSSDARLKKNVETLSGTLEKLGQIRGVSYDLVNGQSARQIGVIAQELEQEFPELVTTDGNGYKAVAYDRLSAVLIEAIKELKTQNQTLQQRLDQLEKKW